MNTKDKHSLWLDSTHSRYFLIPHNHELPSGDFVLCNLTNDEKKVDPATLASFEITEDEAKSHLQAEMNQALEQAKSAYFNIMTFSAQKAPEAAPSTPTTSSDQHQTALTLIEALMGITSEELQHNPEAAQKGFLNLYSELQEVLNGSTSKDPAQIEAARTRMRSLRETLQAQGSDVGVEIEELPNKLREFFSSSEYEQYLKQITAKLRKFTDKIDQSPASFGQSINELIESLSQVLEEEESHLQEKRRQEYSKSAEEAIAASFSKLEFPSLADGFLTLETSQQEEEKQK